MANTGTGVGYYDRGPLEETDRFASQILDVEPVSGTANQYDLLWGYESGWELCPENYTTTVNWGDGTSSTYTGTSCATASAKASKKPSLIGPYCIYTQCFDADHTYTRPGAYNVTFTATDGTVTVNDSTSITTSSADYSAYGPTRIPDTRKGIGAAKTAVKQGSYVKLKVAGNGWIAAVPDGAPAPTTSILNYLTGQTISNTVIVPVGADGRIRLYNGGSTTPVDLIADVAGYFSADAPNAYEPLAAADRAVDTRRSGNTALQPTSSSHFWLPGNLNIVAVIGNMTVTQPSANGFVTAYPDGVTQPSVSNVNFLTGQTVANLAILNTNTSENPATNVYNSSNGTTELIIDVFGYFGS